MKKLTPLIGFGFATMLSCHDNNSNCTTYFLSSYAQENVSTNNLFYNSQGLLSSIISTRLDVSPHAKDTLFFSYDFSNNLTDVRSSGDDPLWVKFYFDSRFQLIATKHLDPNGIAFDSTAMKYDSMSTVTGKVVQRIFYTRSGDEFEATGLEAISYPASGTTLVKHYNVLDYSLVEYTEDTFVTDSKQLPFPQEYYFYNFTLGHPLLLHNIVSVAVKDEPTPVVTTYQYNAGGYPTSSGPYTYSYSCAPTTE